MGTKIRTVVINTNLISVESVVNAAYEVYKEAAKSMLKHPEEFKNGDKIPCVNSVYVEVTKPWYNGMAFLYSGTFDENAFLSVEPEKMAVELSKKIKDTPFIYLDYHSVVSTGNCMVFQNGKCIKKTKSKEGDYNKNIDIVFNKYFGMEKECFKKIDNEYIHNTYYHGQFILGSYSHLLFSLKGDISNNSFYTMKELEYIAVESIRLNPDLTEDEWTKIRQEFDSKAKLPLSYYKNTIYNDYINRHWASRVFSFTDGNLFCKATLLEKPKEIQPEEYFELRKKAHLDYEEWKDKKYGKRPESYTLTEEELKTLSYEEQKAEAYKRLEIARKRGDQSWSSNFYAQGIKFPLDIKTGDYIKLNDGRFARVCFTRLMEDRQNKCFIEEIKACLSKEDKDFHESIFITDMNSFVKVLSADVPDESKIDDNIIKF